MSITYHIDKATLGIGGGGASVSEVQTIVDASTTTIVNTLSTVGIPGEIKLVNNLTGTAPAGTVKIDNIPVDTSFNMLATGELQSATLPKAFHIAEPSIAKYVHCVNANEDFFTNDNSSATSSSNFKRWTASSGYVSQSLTNPSSLANFPYFCLLDSGYLIDVSSSTVNSPTIYYFAPGSSSATSKLSATFPGWGGSRALPVVVNMGSTALFVGGSNNTNTPNSMSTLASAWACEWNPATNSATQLANPPFQVAGSYNFLSTCTLNNAAFFALISRYSTDGTTFVSGTPADAIPVYWLNSSRQWSLLGIYPSPTLTVAGSLVPLASTGNCRIVPIGQYVYLVPYTSNWEAVPYLSKATLVRIDPATGSHTLVDFSVTGGTLPNMICTPVGHMGVHQSIATADGSKLYGFAVGSSQFKNIKLQGLAQSQPTQTFYVRKT